MMVVDETKKRSFQSRSQLGFWMLYAFVHLSFWGFHLFLNQTRDSSGIAVSSDFRFQMAMMQLSLDLFRTVMLGVWLLAAVNVQTRLKSALALTLLCMVFAMRPELWVLPAMS